MRLNSRDIAFEWVCTNSFHAPPTMLDMTQKLSVDIERVFSVEQREAAEFLQKHIFPKLLEGHFFLVGGPLTNRLYF